MESEYKYKRWAWGALIGLAAVIIIAGIVMAMSLSQPKPDKEVATTVNQVEEPQNNEKTTEEPAGNDTTTENDTQTETKSETTTENTQSTTSTEQSNSGSVETPATTTTETSNIPKTGPEDTILPIVALAICSSLFAYNVVLFKKNA